MDPLAPKTDLKDDVLARLRAEILSLALPPGAPLKQAVLADALGVSRQPVSHALEVLKRDRLVVERGRRGLCVASLDPGRIAALYAVRGALDGLAARLAAARRPRRAALAALDTALAAGRAAIAAADAPGLLRADIAFHEGLYALSGNAEIAPAAGSVWPELSRGMAALLRAPGFPRAAWDEHAAIRAAVAAGDPEDAGALAERHCASAAARSAARLTAAPDTPGAPRQDRD